MTQHYTLSQLCASIGRMIQTHYNGNYRIVAETLDVHHNKSAGHYYMELVEKDKSSDNIVARMRAMIWKMDVERIVRRFEKVTAQSFTTGLEVLVSVNLRYHPAYGLSLSIVDIEPEYTLGDIARKRNELIEQLKKEGIYGKNKNIPLRRPTKVIAVISSPTAAGWGDFSDQLASNRAGYPFHCVLFPAAMQGERTERSLLEALDKVKHSSIPFDAVVIIRGGGASADLRYFDSYPLAKAVALFPLPVFTGIGHQRDESLLDHVAAFPLKTPTAVAEFLLDLRREELLLLDQYTHTLSDTLREIFFRSHQRLQQLALRIPTAVHSSLQKEKELVRGIEHCIIRYSKETLSAEKVRCSTKIATLRTSLAHFTPQQKQLLEHLIENISRLLRQQLSHHHDSITQKEKLIQALSPQRTLERGFSIVKKANKAVLSSAQLSDNEPIEIIFSDGKVQAIISQKK